MSAAAWDCMARALVADSFEHYPASARDGHGPAPQRTAPADGAAAEFLKLLARLLGRRAAAEQAAGPDQQDGEDAPKE